MLKDITLGQYYPIDSVIHRLDPRVKLLGVLVYMVVLFIANDVYTFALITLALASLIIVCKVPFFYMIRGLKAILMLMLIAGIFNVFLTPGEPLVTIGVLKITSLGIKNAILMLVRMTYLIIGTSILTLTTSPSEITSGLEKSLGFLNAMNVPVHELAMMITIALRFIPLFMEETDKLIKAQQARGADFDTGSIFKRAKAMIPILIPLIISSFRRANDLAMAMEARCYNGGKDRTKMYPLKYKSIDRNAYILIFMMLLGTILLRVLL